MGKIANPYPGSRAFEQADQALFFGRAADTAAITSLWLANRLTILSGPVASGKTSLLQAGVYPAMPVQRSLVLPAGNLFHGMTFPFPALTEHNPFTLALLRSWSPEDIPTRLAGLSVSDFVRRFAVGRDGASYAAIDQVDDLILGLPSGAEAKWRKLFLAELTQAMADNPRLHLLLVTRSEAVALLTGAVGGGAHHAIAGLTRQQAFEAVTGPALAAGTTFAKDAAYCVIDDLLGPGPVDPQTADRVEPSLLQVACRDLWKRMPADDSQVSAWTAGEAGSADAALTAHCGQVISEVAELYDIPFTELHHWLIDHFLIDSDTRNGAYEGTQFTAKQPNVVPRALRGQHLLTSELKDSVPYYRLLARRLIEPVQKASAKRRSAPQAAKYLRAAELRLAAGELDLAWTHGERVLRDSSDLRERAQAESLLGNVKQRRGEPDEALTHYRQAAELLQATGDTAAAAYQLAAVGRLLLAAGDAAGALPELRAAVERVPHDLALQTQLALALWHLGDGQAAVAILNWVLSIEGGYPEALRSRGAIRADLGEAHDALLDLDRALPDRPLSQAARGLALAKLGDYTAAAKEIKGALADARGSGLVLLYAARVADLAGDKVAARDRAREASDATDPPLSPAHKQLAGKLARRRVDGAQPARRRSSLTGRDMIEEIRHVEGVAAVGRTGAAAARACPPRRTR
jgi:tetratricopeptide (TPR) repeat protein